jgi:hypothetical protein
MGGRTIDGITMGATNMGMETMTIIKTTQTLITIIMMTVE